MNKNIALENEVRKQLTKVQCNLVEKAFGNISSILNMEKAINWCNQNKIYSIIIFGSRTRLHEVEESDLDVMITDCSKLDDFNEDDYMKKQKELVDSLYQSFLDRVVKNKTIKLDFKLNTNRFYSEGYNGLDANTPYVCEENDFYFNCLDIPSYFEIENNKVYFRIATDADIEDVFNEDSFLEVVK